MGKWHYKTWRAEKAYAEILIGEQPVDSGGEVHIAIAEAQTISQPEPAPAPPPDPVPIVRRSKRVSGE